MRVALSGTVCVGKTTLTKILESGGWKIAKEPFTYLNKDNLSMNELQLMIGCEEVLKHHETEQTVLDRCWVDMIAFNRFLRDKGQISNNIYTYLENTALKLKPLIDVYFYIPIEFPYKQDDRIETEQDRIKLDMYIQDVFKENKIKPIMLTGKTMHRLNIFYQNT